MTLPQTILQTQNLSKRYRRRWAVRDLNLEVFRGDVFGFLGPNGAGKSTTIRMILSLIKPTEGTVNLFGKGIQGNRKSTLQKVGGIVESPDFYDYLSAYRNLDIVGALYGGVTKKRILEVLELVGLADRAQDKVKAYSHGMKQRLGIAQALLPDPELIILDEPTSGLDPQGMKDVRELIKTLAFVKGKTIFLSSHILHEIEMVANRMAIINQGKLVVQGEVSKLLDEGEQYVVLKATPKDRVERILKSKDSKVTQFSFVQGAFKITMKFGDIPQLNAALVKQAVKVHSIVPRRSLEDYFLTITESALPKKNS